jgi:hypothetical protein
MSTNTEKRTVRPGTVTVEFENIKDSGSYYNHLTGWLVRMPDETLSLGHSPIMDIVSKNQSLFTRISEDPYVPLNKARRICADLDFDVNF